MWKDELNFDKTTLFKRPKCREFEQMILLPRSLPQMLVKSIINRRVGHYKFSIKTLKTVWTLKQK